MPESKGNSKMRNNDNERMHNAYKQYKTGEMITAEALPSISVLSEREQTLILKLVLHDAITGEELLNRDFGIYTLILTINEMVNGAITGLRSLSFGRGRVLSMPGQKKDSINTIKDCSVQLRKMANLLDKLAIES